MNKVLCYIFWGERASGKSILAGKLDSIDTPDIKVIDDFRCTDNSSKNLVAELSETHFDYPKLEPSMYVIITWATTEEGLRPLLDRLQYCPWLIVNTCKFARG